MSEQREWADRSAFHGRQDANGIVLDVALVGEAVARERVLRHWQPGSRLLTLPDHRWLLVLVHPVSLEAERAPGLPVTIAPEGTVRILRHGRVTMMRLDDCPEVPIAEWVDLSALRVEHVRSIEVPPVVVVPRILDPLPTPDLRRVARVREDAGAERMVKELDAAARRRSVRPSQSGRGAGRWFDALLGRMPVPAAVSRRHQRYLSALIHQFEQRDYDSALRRAIALGGTGGRLSLRLPNPRIGALRPGRRSSSGRGLPVGSVESQLRTLYAQAAEALEAEGRIDEAAFVLADLLGSTLDAVNLLERHERFAQAAELAQAYAISAETVVRLWWRAKRRDRAVAYAVARGAFAGAVEALQLVDPVSAQELRRAWVQARQAAGDHLAAVRAAWPEVALRDVVLGDVRAGIAQGGPASGELIALLVTHRPTDPALVLVETLLATSDPDLVAVRDRYVMTLSDHEAADPVADRRLATGAARSVFRDESLAGLTTSDAVRRWNALLGRADPLAAADLPRPLFRRPQPGDLDLVGFEPGAVAVFDAVELTGGVLVALGALGVRLLSADGRTRARWRIPTDGFVVADHGGTVLLLNRGERIVDLHRLDLATRQVRHWSTIALRRILPSYDGAVLMAQDDDGLVFLDTTSAVPRVLWREFGPSTSILDLARSPTGLAALVSDPQVLAGMPELWRWSTPDLLLRSRVAVDLVDAVAGALTADGGLLTLHRPPGEADGENQLAVNFLSPGRQTANVVTVESGIPYAVQATGVELMTSTLVGATTVVERLRRPPPDGPAVRVALPGRAETPGERPVPQPLGIREHAGRIVVFDAAGRVVGFDVAAGAATANFVVRTAD